MSGLWSEPGFPHKGWSWLGCDDLGEYPSSHQCPVCAREWPRYIHTVHHPEYGTLQVGCVCAEEITQDYVNPRARETELKSRTARREHFPDRAGWQLTTKGNHRLRIDGLVAVVARRHNGRYGLGFVPMLSDRWWWSPRTYGSLRDAQLAAFDLLEKRRHDPRDPALSPGAGTVGLASDMADAHAEPQIVDEFDIEDALAD